MENNNPFPKLKPRGTFTTKNISNNEINEASQNQPSNNDKTNNFLSKIKFFEQKSLTINKKTDNDKTIKSNKEQENAILSKSLSAHL